MSKLVLVLCVGWYVINVRSDYFTPACLHSSLPASQSPSLPASLPTSLPACLPTTSPPQVNVNGAPPRRSQIFLPRMPVIFCLEYSKEEIFYHENQLKTKIYKISFILSDNSIMPTIGRISASVIRRCPRGLNPHGYRPVPSAIRQSEEYVIR